MYIKIQSSKIFYSSRGSENPLVLLHGFLESSSIWRDISEKVSKERQVICIDLPGHGKSEVLGEIHSMELMAEVVSEVLKELDVRRADFLGHSMGGYICLAFLELFPERVGKIALVNSTPAPDSEARKLNRERAISVVRKNKSAFVSMAISNLMMPSNYEKFKGELEEMKAEAKNFPTEGITALLNGMKIRTDRTALWKNFGGGKFMVLGINDPILDPKETKNIAESSNSRLFEFQGGHMSFLENRQDFEEFVYFIE